MTTQIGPKIGYSTALDSGGYLAFDDISSGPMLLTQIGGFNTDVVPIYVLIFNELGNPPATPAVQSFLIPAGGSFSWEPSQGGRIFSVGCSWAVSSTGDIYTPYAQDIWVFAEGYDLL